MTEVHLAHDRKETFEPLPPGSKGMVGLLSGEKRALQAPVPMCAPALQLQSCLLYERPRALSCLVCHLRPCPTLGCSLA